MCHVNIGTCQLKHFNNAIILPCLLSFCCCSSSGRMECVCSITILTSGLFSYCLCWCGWKCGVFGILSFQCVMCVKLTIVLDHCKIRLHHHYIERGTIIYHSATFHCYATVPSFHYFSPHITVCMHCSLFVCSIEHSD